MSALIHDQIHLLNLVFNATARAEQGSIKDTQRSVCTTVRGPRLPYFRNLTESFTHFSHSVVYHLDS